MHNNGNLLASPWTFRQHGESGIPISSLFPNLGTVADELCVIRSMTDQLQSVDGVTIDWLLVSQNWSCAGHQLREVGLREKVGVIVVAVVRDGETLPTPGPDFEVHAGDTLVVVGTADAVTAAGAMLRGD